MAPRIISIIGGLDYDLIMSTDRVPGPGKSVVANEYRRHWAAKARTLPSRPIAPVTRSLLQTVLLLRFPKTSVHAWLAPSATIKTARSCKPGSRRMVSTRRESSWSQTPLRASVPSWWRARRARIAVALLSAQHQPGARSTSSA